MNKPVAWMWEQEINGLATETVFFTEKPFNNKAIPLYTHPVELTDELLMELYEVADYSPESYLELAKTILRKAQSKPSRKCGDSYDTVCPPSICDCQGKAQEK